MERGQQYDSSYYRYYNNADSDASDQCAAEVRRIC